MAGARVDGTGLAALLIGYPASHEQSRNGDERGSHSRGDVPRLDLALRLHPRRQRDFRRSFFIMVDFRHWRYQVRVYAAQPARVIPARPVTVRAGADQVSSWRRVWRWQRIFPVAVAADWPGMASHVFILGWPFPEHVIPFPFGFGLPCHSSSSGRNAIGSERSSALAGHASRGTCRGRR